jgi:hypothetical protein
MPRIIETLIIQQNKSAIYSDVYTVIYDGAEGYEAAKIEAMFMLANRLMNHVKEVKHNKSKNKS